jgi:hypothetical protein
LLHLSQNAGTCCRKDIARLGACRGSACKDCASRKPCPRLFGGLLAHTTRRSSLCNPLRTGTVMSLPRLGQASWGRAPSGILCLSNPLVWACSVQVFDMFPEERQPTTQFDQVCRERTARKKPKTSQVGVSERRRSPPEVKRRASRLPARRSMVRKASRRSSRSATSILSDIAKARGTGARRDMSLRPAAPA